MDSRKPRSSTAWVVDSRFLLNGLENEENPILSLGLRYIEFATVERNLFLFLFQSGGLDGNITSLFENEELLPIMAEITSRTGISDVEVKKIFFPLFSAVHGNASLLANNTLDYDEEETKKMLVFLFNSLINGMGNEYEE